MKICAIICEFNPFHNGHAYLLENARRLSGCDALVCVMSGSFTQRGELAVLDKFIRAKHAVLSGADVVLELPANFAVAPAEIFAKGAVKICRAIGAEKIAFGSESGNKEALCGAAQLLISESDCFKAALARRLDGGKSYIQSYFAAFSECGGDGNLLKKPNDILALEYIKAVLRENANIGILPVKRVGAEFSDGELKDNFSSAGAIRNNLSSELVKSNVPDFVYGDLAACDTQKAEENFRILAAYAAMNAQTVDLKRIYGCGEGLENKIKSLAAGGYCETVSGCTSRRYSSSRIKRILCANLLGLYSDETAEMLKKPPVKLLAVKKSSADNILPALSPALTESDENTARAYKVWNFLHSEVKKSGYDKTIYV